MSEAAILRQEKLELARMQQQPDAEKEGRLTPKNTHVDLTPEAEESVKDAKAHGRAAGVIHGKEDESPPEAPSMSSAPPPSTIAADAAEEEGVVHLPPMGEDPLGVWESPVLVSSSQEEVAPNSPDAPEFEAESAKRQLELILQREQAPL